MVPVVRAVLERNFRFGVAHARIREALEEQGRAIGEVRRHSER